MADGKLQAIVAMLQADKNELRAENAALRGQLEASREHLSRLQSAAHMAGARRGSLESAVDSAAARAETALKEKADMLKELQVLRARSLASSRSASEELRTLRQQVRACVCVLSGIPRQAYGIRVAVLRPADFRRVTISLPSLPVGCNARIRAGWCA